MAKHYTPSNNMPAITAPATVLVTGASGFIAAHAIQAILERGFKVVGTVRSNSKGQYLENLFAAKYSGKFSFVVVEDIQKEGVFDEIVKGIDAVEHIASPFHTKTTNPEDYLGPAIKGTLAILNSILKYGSSVKRVVITSSVASVGGPRSGPYVFTEADWNTTSPAIVEEKGKDAPVIEMYCASKVIAERSAWEFVEAHRDEISWDLVTILPPYVFGRTIHEIISAEAINTSISWFKEIILDPAGASTSKDILVTSPGSWVDVRDVATAHAVSLTNPAAGGERFVTTVGGFTWQGIMDAINVPTLTLSSINKGFPGEVQEITVYCSGAKAAKVLGLRYYDLRTTAIDTVKSLQERFP